MRELVDFINQYFDKKRGDDSTDTENFYKNEFVVWIQNWLIGRLIAQQEYEGRLEYINGISLYRDKVATLTESHTNILFN